MKKSKMFYLLVLRLEKYNLQNKYQPNLKSKKRKRTKIMNF